MSSDKNTTFKEILEHPRRRKIKKVNTHRCPEAKIQFTELFNSSVNRLLVHFGHFFTLSEILGSKNGVLASVWIGIGKVVVLDKF